MGDISPRAASPLIGRRLSPTARSVQGSRKVRVGTELATTRRSGGGRRRTEEGVVPWLIVVGHSGALEVKASVRRGIGFLFVGYRAGGTDRRRQTRFVVASGRTRVTGLIRGGGTSDCSHAHTRESRGRSHVLRYGKVDSMSITCRLRVTLGRRGCTGWPVGPFDDYL